MRIALVLGVAVLLSGCATLASLEQRVMSGSMAGSVVGESDDFIVVSANGGETAEGLARTHLGDAGKSWMIEDFMGGRTFARGQQVVIPKKPWNMSGVEANGYQLVPVLVYHNIGKEARGRLVLGVDAFTEQMKYLKASGFRVVSVAEFVDWLQQRRQLPKKTVVLTFDDGYRSFREHGDAVRLHGLRGRRPQRAQLGRSEGAHGRRLRRAGALQVARRPAPWRA
jgi:hypothetical protein